MKPLTLSMSGWRHYLSPQTIRFQDGCTAIVGANGAGKSSILQAIEVALFGPDGRSLAPYVTWGHDTMTVELMFEHGERVYTVRRSSQRGKHLLDLETLGDLAQVALTRETVKATQEELERILGFTRATLRASSLLMQGDASAWVDRDPRDRKQVLADVLGLDRYGALLAETRARRRTIDTELADKRGRLAVLREHADPLAELKERAQALHADWQRVEKELADTVAEQERLAALVAESEQRDRERRDAQHQVDVLDARAVALRRVDLDATVALEKADAIRQDIVRLERLADELAQVRNRIAELEQADRARQAALDERQRLVDVATAAAEVVERAEANAKAADAARLAFVSRVEEIETGVAGTCTECGQEIHGEARATALANAHEQRDQASARFADLAHEAQTARLAAIDASRAVEAVEVPDEPEGLADLRARHADLERVPQDLAAARARLEALDQQVAAANTPEHQAARDETEQQLANARASLAAIEPTLALDGARSAHADTARRAKELATERDQLRARTAETGALLELAENATRQAGQLADEIARLDRDSSDLQELEQGYGPNGIPLLIVESVAVPAIEQHANDILSRLALDYRVEIRTQTETKDGTLRDALDVIVWTGQGEAAFEQLSGSEKTRVAVALRVGLARLLAARRGADCRMLALDEPEGLDGTVRPLLVDVLRDLEAGRVFDQVLLVSHESDLRDAFDQSIEVHRGDDGWSAINGGKR